MLFLYLKKINVQINKKEFIIQFESHPEYPSLLAISDTLHFFNVINGALHVNQSEIDSLPKIFITKLNDTHENALTFVETHKENHSYRIYNHSKTSTITKDVLLEKWKGIVFLVENNVKKHTNAKKYTWTHFLLFCCFISIIFLLKHPFFKLQQLLFLVFPLIGFLFSLAALKNIFNINHTFIDTICNGENSKNCESVINASHWKILEKVNFSDLSITFFFFQVVTLAFAGFTNTLDFFFQLQKLLLFAAIPILLMSLYYQKFIAKQWCSICISIIGVVITELIYVVSLFEFNFELATNFYHYNFYLFSYLLVLVSWNSLKDTLININTLRSELVQANRFKRNYSIFKNTLISHPKFVVPQTSLVFGKGTKLTIDFITSPYCGFCKAPTEMLRGFLEKYGKHITVRFIYNVNLEIRNDTSKQFLRNLIYIQQKFGNEKFFNALDYWYETKNHEKWLKKYQQEFDPKTIYKTLKLQRLWCIENKFTFTPCIFLNGYAHPKMYAISDIKYFIEELIDDTIIKLAEAEKLSTE